MSKPREDFYFRPLTEGQQEATAAFAASDISLFLGPAGSRKTHLALALAAREVEAGRDEKVLLCRPLVEAGEKLGYLPGDLNRKLGPWLEAARDVLRRLTLKPNEWLKKHAEVVPLALMRGRTFDRRVAILTEAQNATMSQLKLFLTRIGHKGQLILEGDPTQCDLGFSPSPLSVVADRLDGLPGVSVTRLAEADVVRHPIIPHMLRRLA